MVSRNAGVSLVREAELARHVEDAGRQASLEQRTAAPRVHVVRQRQPHIQPTLGVRPAHACDAAQFALQRVDHDVAFAGVGLAEFGHVGRVLAPPHDVVQQVLQHVYRAEIVVALLIEHRLNEVVGQECIARLHAGREGFAERHCHRNPLISNVIRLNRWQIGPVVSQLAVGGVLQHEDAVVCAVFAGERQYFRPALGGDACARGVVEIGNDVNEFHFAQLASGPALLEPLPKGVGSHPVLVGRDGDYVRPGGFQHGCVHEIGGRGRNYDIADINQDVGQQKQHLL